MSSSRVKRLLRRIENFRGSKKQRRMSGSEDEGGKCASSVWTPKSLGDFPSTNIYNSVSRSPPAELFRKDLISAMKLPDSEPLSSDDYWVISDQWKQEWERGVQVPVNPESLPVPSVRIMRKKDKSADFKLPKRLVRMTPDDSFYTSETHQMSDAASLAEKVCRYDLDDCDLHWLNITNDCRKEIGLPVIEEDAMENIMEELESKCYTNMQQTIHSEAVLGIEYDETVICDVCRSPDSEEGNEMVFCDSCDICVHQACYGITDIPDGSWLCRTCSLALKPSCVLCPNKGGAMKCTRTGQKWAHVSCALWIPEVSIGCVEMMEPITKVTQIPPSRWALICCLCRERVGACIQCSVKSCKTAYHVTCGFHNGLEMKAVVEDENDEDGVKLRSYCPKHSMDKDSSVSSDSEGEGGLSVKLKGISSEDKANARARRLRQIEASFFKYAKVSEVAECCHCAVEIVQFVYYYWKLKRSAGFNVPLLSPRSGENDGLVKVQEDGFRAQVKMFIHLRQDLERVRNLCYMVIRRERLSRSWTRMREQIFHKQVSVMTDPSLQLTPDEKRSVVHACHGRNIYDRLFANNSSCCATQKGAAVTTPLVTESTKLLNDTNGFVKCPRKPQSSTAGEKPSNPYAKTYFLNGLSGRSRRKSENTTDVNELKSSKNHCGVGVEGVITSEFSPARNVLETKNSSVVNKDLVPQEDCDPVETDVDSAKVIKSKQYPLQLQYQQQKHFTRSASHKVETVGSETGTPIKSEPELFKNGVCSTSQSVDKKVSESCVSFGSVFEEVKDDTKYLSVNENMERLAIDASGSPNNISEQQHLGEDNESEESMNAQKQRHRKSKPRFRNLRSPTEKTPPKESGGKTISVVSPSTLDSPPFRDKLRQESAKIHESLFSSSLKGSLAGYRIPKKLRSESESEPKHEDANTTEQQQQQQQSQMIETVRSNSQSQEQPYQNHVPFWKENPIVPIPLVTCNSIAVNNNPPQLQSPVWNCNPRPLALLPTPSIPRLPLPLSPDRCLTRRDKSLYVSSSNSVTSPTSKTNGRADNGCSGRLVIKLRKDPNYPESHRWRRDGDIADSGGYKYNCDQSDVDTKHIRHKLNSRYDRHHHGRDHSNHQSNQSAHSPLSCRSSDSRSYNKHNSPKYSMRSRSSLSESGSCGQSFSSNVS